MSYHVWDGNLNIVRTDVYDIKYNSRTFIYPIVSKWSYKKYISEIDISKNNISINDICHNGIPNSCIIGISAHNISKQYDDIYSLANYKYMILRSDSRLSENVVQYIKMSGKIHMIDRDTYLEYVHVDPEHTGLMYQEYCRYTFNKRIFLKKADFDIEFRYGKA